MNSFEFILELWNWLIWVKREKDIKVLNLKDKFQGLGVFYVVVIGFWINFGENVNSFCQLLLLWYYFMKW